VVGQGEKEEGRRIERDPELPGTAYFMRMTDATRQLTRQK
jgi:hypothetical protein